jgi:hypothetical protein
MGAAETTSATIAARIRPIGRTVACASVLE